MILGTNGCKCMSMSCEIFSVGPPQPLTIGLTAIGFLWIFKRNYSCCVRGIFSGLKLRYSLVMLSTMPFLFFVHL